MTFQTWIWLMCFFCVSHNSWLLAEQNLISSNLLSFKVHRLVNDSHRQIVLFSNDALSTNRRGRKQFFTYLTKNQRHSFVFSRSILDARQLITRGNKALCLRYPYISSDVPHTNCCHVTSYIWWADCTDAFVAHPVSWRTFSTHSSTSLCPTPCSSFNWS